MDEQNKIFREKSLEQLSSPEELTSYLRVAGTGVWFVLVGIIVLIAGLIVWGIFGKLYTTVTVPAEVTDGLASCYILTDDITLDGGTVDIRIGDQHMVAEADQAETSTLDSSADASLYASGYLSPGKNVVVLTCPTTLENGTYNAIVTTETLNPISLLFAKS